MGEFIIKSIYHVHRALWRVKNFVELFFSSRSLSAKPHQGGVVVKPKMISAATPTRLEKTMIHLRFVFLALLVIDLMTACASPAAQPTLTPPPPSATPPCPDDLVSATPLPPGSDLGTTPLPQPYAPQPGDKQLERGEVFIDHSELLTAESFPPQFFVALAGSLPTPCHQLRLTAGVEANSQRIVVTAYSLANPQAVCVQMLKPFNVNLPLGNLPSGKYEVWVNGQPVGEIVAP